MNATSGNRPGAGAYGEWRLAVEAPADPRFAHLGWPKVAKTPRGSLAVACSAGRRHVDGEGCPAVAVSRDGARTFTRPRVLATFGDGAGYRHCGNVALGVAGDGAVVLLAMAFTLEERHTVLGWRSADDGESWEEVDCRTLGDNRTGSVFGHVFRVLGKGLAVCGHYRPPRGHGIWIAFSPDEGRSWGEPQTIAGQKLFEPTFISVEGRLIGLVRENEAQGYHEWVSDDAGATWRKPRLVMQGAAAVYPSPFVVADPMEPGRLLALQSQRTGRGEVYLWTARADELAWERAGLVASFEGFEDYSYPWMCHVAGDRWWAVCYAGERDGANSLWGAELRIGR